MTQCWWSETPPLPWGWGVAVCSLSGPWSPAPFSAVRTPSLPPVRLVNTVCRHPHHHCWPPFIEKNPKGWQFFQRMATSVCEWLCVLFLLRTHRLFPSQSRSQALAKLYKAMVPSPCWHVISLYSPFTYRELGNQQSEAQSRCISYSYHGSARGSTEGWGSLIPQFSGF